MTEPTETTQPLSLASRIIGVITAPKATFQNIVAVPRPVGVLLVVALVMSIGQSIPQFTEAGRKSALEQQVKMIERFGQTVTPEAYQKMEERAKSPVTHVIGIAAAFIILPVVVLFFAAIYWAIFNTILGGTALFKQVLAIVTHAQVIAALGLLLGLPIQLMRGQVSFAGPFNLGALAPMLEEGSKLATILGSIDVFRLWASIVTGIGLGVLYKRSGRNIAIALVLVYLLLTIGLASAFSSFMPR
jgi:hypothetical protein